MRVPSINNWRGVMNQTVTITKLSTSASSGRDFYGAPSYQSVTTTHRARYVASQHKTVDSQGREVLSRGKVWIGETSTGGVPSMGPKDKLTLPGSTTVTPLLNIETFPDDAGNTHHQVAHTG